MLGKRGLGRGLDALLTSEPAEAEAFVELPVDLIDPNALQPRKAFEPKALQDLAGSIKASGLIQPVVVRKVGERWQLIVGERRWRAAKLAGIARIPALVREASDVESLELAVVENLLREDLNPIEEGEAYQKLLADYGWTQEALGQRVGRDRSTISNSLRLLRLPEVIQEDLKAGRLTMGHARALLSLATPAEQLKLREEILAHSWSVRATEEGVQKQRTRRPKARQRSAEIAALEEELQRALMTKVKIVGNERRGRIEVTYATLEELDRLSDLLGARP